MLVKNKSIFGGTISFLYDLFQPNVRSRPIFSLNITYIIWKYQFTSRILHDNGERRALDEEKAKTNYEQGFKMAWSLPLPDRKRLDVCLGNTLLCIKLLFLLQKYLFH